MIRALASLLTGSLLGCGARAPAPPALPSAPPSIAAPAATPVEETPDEGSRYQPPSLETTSSWAPSQAADLR